MENDMSLRNLAHLGDSVYELFIREYTITQTQNIKKLQKLFFQCKMNILMILLIFWLQK